VEFSGTIDLCFTWVEGQVADEDHVRLLHYEDGEWVDVTTSRDTVANVICGTVSSLSAFVLAEDTQPPTLATECSPTVLWPPNHKMVGVTVGIDAADNSGKPPAITVGVTSDEAEDGGGDGDRGDGRRHAGPARGALGQGRRQDLHDHDHGHRRGGQRLDGDLRGEGPPQQEEVARALAPPEIW
jgi:hypothetical protein